MAEAPNSQRSGEDNEASKANGEKGAEPSQGADRAEVLGAIKSPLILYGLVILIAESVFGGITAVSPLTEPHKFIIDILLVVLFFFVSTVVGVITFFRPGGLSPEMMKEARQAYHISADLQKFINDKGFQDLIADIIKENVKPDALSEHAMPKRLERRQENDN